MPAGSSDPPESTTGSRIAFVSVLLQMEFTCARSVTTTAVVSYTAFPPLPPKEAVYFCCTGLGVTSTGRYPASCPVKPGLSSPDSLRCQPRSFIPLGFFIISSLYYQCQKKRNRTAHNMMQVSKSFCIYACNDQCGLQSHRRTTLLLTSTINVEAAASYELTT